MPRLMGLTEDEARALGEKEGRALRVLYRHPGGDKA
jgi:hypothetical protein